MRMRLPLGVGVYVSLCSPFASVSSLHLNFSNGVWDKLSSLELYCLPWDFECGFVAFGVWECRGLTMFRIIHAHSALVSYLKIFWLIHLASW